VEIGKIAVRKLLRIEREASSFVKEVKGASQTGEKENF
jgi:hypothetical protein